MGAVDLGKPWVDLYIYKVASGHVAVDEVNRMCHARWLVGPFIAHLWLGLVRSCFLGLV